VTVEAYFENHLVLVFLNWTGTHKEEFQGMPPTNSLWVWEVPIFIEYKMAWL
jgi:hypothetical protein